MKKKTIEKIALPALRGIMGDWVFYSCLMSTREISERVHYADEVHKNKSLSDMIQRQLNSTRSNQIATYLQTQDERFFNSLVVATYGGQPSWHSLTDVRSKASNQDLKNLSEETVESLGFLVLQGGEKLFAVDGQHRLSGIKKFIQGGFEKNDVLDCLSVIFVAHKTTAKGLERTRRLFTTLNKTARPVSKGEIVALDEDDVMAICTRRLIERTSLFNGERIAFVASNNMPVTNKEALTTIVSLYDLLTVLFTKAHSDLRKTKADLVRVRPSDENLEAYFEYAKKFFNLLKKHFPELDEFFKSKDLTKVVSKHRGAHGGNALYRPIGLDVFIQIIAKLSNEYTLTESIKIAAMLPRKLAQKPFVDLMWNTSTSTIMNTHRVTLREVLLYMIGDSKFSDEKLLERYRKDTGDDKAKLPKMVL